MKTVTQRYYDASNPGEWELNRRETLLRLSSPEPYQERLTVLEGRDSKVDAPDITPA